MSDSEGEGIDGEKQVKIVILGETNVGKVINENKKKLTFEFSQKSSIIFDAW